MAIFPHAEIEEVVQVGDRTRLSAIKSFVDKGAAAITLVEIEPEAAAGFIDVSGALPLKEKNWFTDWEYATEGVAKVVTIRITTDGAPVTSTFTIDVISAADDNLFSSDGDLIGEESDILNYVRDGRNTFLDFHRSAQTKIMDWFDRNSHHDIVDGDRLTKADVIDVQEVREWSKLLTLSLIFKDASNAVDDINGQKAISYKSKAIEARKRGTIKLDFNKDGSLDSGERKVLQTLDMVRR